MCKSKVSTLVGISSLVWLASFPVQAQTSDSNIEKLKQMKVSGTDPNIPSVAQTGKNADQLRENLKRIQNCRPDSRSIFMPSCPTRA
jgi:hypothetical protein